VSDGPGRGGDEPDPAVIDDPIDGDAVSRHLATTWLGRARHIHLAVCASTNDIASAEARGGAAQGLVVTADAQTSGRGRLGRVWHSPAGANIYVSVLLRPRRPAAEIPPVTLLAGGAVAAALSALGFDVRVKWPNDVLLATGGHVRKVAGILTEAQTEGDRVGHVVVGIGLNVHTRRFADDLADKATSLALAGGRGLMRARILAHVLATFEAAYDRFQARGAAAAIELWEAHASLGVRCRARVGGATGGTTVEGITEGVAADGALELRDDDGVVHHIVAGEVVPVTEA